MLGSTVGDSGSVWFNANIERRVEIHAYRGRRTRSKREIQREYSMLRRIFSVFAPDIEAVRHLHCGTAYLDCPNNGTDRGEGGDGGKGEVFDMYIYRTYKTVSLLLG